MRLREIQLSISWRKSEVGRGMVRFVRYDVMISTCAPAMEGRFFVPSVGVVLTRADTSIRAVISKIPRNRMTSD